MEQQTARPAFLLLENGRLLQGEAFGAQTDSIGSLAFHTASIGYQQLLTDPESAGQMVLETFPSIGNYGVNNEDDESANVRAAGVIVREWCDLPQNFRSTGDIDSFLRKEGIPGLCGIDTRALARFIRDNGELRAMLLHEMPQDIERKLEALKQWKPDKPAAPREASHFSAGNPVARVKLIDFGCKNSFLQSLVRAGLSVDTEPFTQAGSTAGSTDQQGIVLSSGPELILEDEALAGKAVEAVQRALQSGRPVFAVGLGHLLLAKARGGALGRLGHGHRGANVPVTDNKTGRTVVTTQNHRYYVQSAAGGEVSHVNPSDKTCEGIRYEDALSVQFIPSYETGSMNTGGLFREYIGMITGAEAAK